VVRLEKRTAVHSCGASDRVLPCENNIAGVRERRDFVSYGFSCIGAERPRKVGCGGGEEPTGDRWKREGAWEKHADTLTSLSNLAFVLIRQGKYEAVMEMNTGAREQRESAREGKFRCSDEHR